jgi:hypothetical protein
MNSPYHAVMAQAGFIFVVFILILVVAVACDKQDDQAEMVFTSWRIDDVAEMDGINEFSNAPTIEF